jgi:hypothetical protein
MIICCMYVSDCMLLYEIENLRLCWISQSMFSFKLSIIDRFRYISVRICSFSNNRICPVHFCFRHSRFHIRPIKKYESENRRDVFSDRSHPFSGLGMISLICRQKYSETLIPKHFITNPSISAHNDGLDNENWDHILYVNVE